MKKATAATILIITTALTLMGEITPTMPTTINTTTTEQEA